MIKVVNTITAEVFEFKTDTTEQIVEAYNQAAKLEQAAKRAKQKIRDLIVERNLDGESTPDYEIKIIHTQKQDYDLSIMREVLDDDQFNTFIKPDKTALDKFIKENIETIPEVKTLRDSMIDVGTPYITVRVDKI